jgi:hypothetical protein
MTSDCIEAMNEAYMVCISKIDPDQREFLKDWAAAKVEVGYCLERRDVIVHCLEEWGRKKGVPASLMAELKEIPAQAARKGGAA